MIDTEPIFPPLPNSSNETIITAYKSFYRTYFIKNPPRKQDITKFGRLLIEGRNFIPRRTATNYFLETSHWTKIDNFIKNKLSIKLHKDILEDIEENYKDAITPNIDNNLGVFQSLAAYVSDSSQLKQKLVLDIAGRRLDYLEKVQECLSFGGLHPLIFERAETDHKKYNILIKDLTSNCGVLISREETLNIIRLAKSGQLFYLNEKPITLFSRPQISVSSTLLKEDEIELFLRKNGKNYYSENLNSFNKENFFLLCDEEKINLNSHFVKLKPFKSKKLETTVNTTRPKRKVKRSVVKRPLHKQILKLGRYKALLIGIDSYDNHQDLENPIKDVTRLKNVLNTKYHFDEIKILKNPTKSEIIDELEELSDDQREGDSLLIFFAGHGEYNKNKGFWIPKDADKVKRGKWIRNKAIFDHINDLKESLHVLVIADSCFSGSLLDMSRGGNLDTAKIAIQTHYDTKSRLVMTSGAKEEVPDASVFLKKLTDFLDSFTGRYLTTNNLFSGIRDDVITESPKNQKPQFGKMAVLGNDGGEFIFVRKL